MKAIHNVQFVQITKTLTVFNTSKIQNESNSQHRDSECVHFYTVFNTSKIQNESNSQQIEHCALSRNNCFQYFKDTK